MESPNRRLKQSPSELEGGADFVPLGGDHDEEQASRYGFSASNGSEGNVSGAPAGRRAMQQPNVYRGRTRNAGNDPRNAKDRPKSKHSLPGHEPWILVKTALGRRFVHNTATKESFWHIPQDVFAGVLAFEEWERQQKEKDANAKWAEGQLQEMRGKGRPDEETKAADLDKLDKRRRRRRSESLQREDEEAMMAELAAEAERAEEQDVKEVVKELEPLKPLPEKGGGGGDGYDSDGSYEEVEVTDSEFEEDDEQRQRSDVRGEGAPEGQQDDAPVEFGEDDIAYQLAAMGEDDDYDPSDPEDEGRDEGRDEDDLDDRALALQDEANLFREMLDDHNISPFTPWDKLISDQSESSIILDDRYTSLPNMRTRKEVWESWVKDTAARLREERAKMEKMDPKIPYLAFLAEKATPKLYWPEFKRKYRKESIMNERALADKEREKLYRAHISRLTLPENTRKADLEALLQSVPLSALHRSTSVDALPQQILGHVHFISLPPSIRDAIIAKRIASLPPPPAADAESMDEQRADEDAKRGERRKREKALAERERKVEEDRRKAEEEERRAKRDLRDEERGLRKAMEVDNRGIKAQLREE